MNLTRLEYWEVDGTNVIASSIEEALKIYKEIEYSMPVEHVNFKGAVYTDGKIVKDGAGIVTMDGGVITISGFNTLSEVEKKVIELTLYNACGSRKVAADKLGISERTLYRKIEEYGL